MYVPDLHAHCEIVPIGARAHPGENRVCAHRTHPPAMNGVSARTGLEGHTVQERMGCAHNFSVWIFPLSFVMHRSCVRNYLYMHSIEYFAYACSYSSVCNMRLKCSGRVYIFAGLLRIFLRELSPFCLHSPHSKRGTLSRSTNPPNTYWPVYGLLSS